MKSLIVVDMQNDFMPGGPLGVARADQLVPIINRLMPKFPLCVCSQDWHPIHHISFSMNHPGKKAGDVIEVGGLMQVLWPIHCVQNTEGAELVQTLNRSGFQGYFHKGTDPMVDSYSTFFDNARKHSTGLERFLKDRFVDAIYFAGVATDYCVLYSASDALELGFKVYVVEDACAGIDLHQGDVKRALETIAAKGGRIIRSTDL
jgi:nicotinamidase/pyrazinamidase